MSAKTSSSTKSKLEALLSSPAQETPQEKTKKESVTADNGKIIRKVALVPEPLYRELMESLSKEGIRSFSGGANYIFKQWINTH